MVYTVFEFKVNGQNVIFELYNSAINLAKEAKLSKCFTSYLLCFNQDSNNFNRFLLFPAIKNEKFFKLTFENFT